YNYAYVPLLLGLSIVYLLRKAWRCVILMRPVTYLDWQTMMRGYVAGTAATLLPGGITARAGLMHQAGVSVERSAGPVALSSILDQAVFVVGALIAALFVPAARTPALILLGVVIVLGIIMAIPFIREKLLKAAGWAAKKLGFEDRWNGFIDCLPEILTWKRLLITFGITAAAVIPLIVVLDFSLRGLDVQVPYPTLFLAYILPTMLGRISALPAGVGVTEAGMVGYLSNAAATADIDVITAAVAIFRITTVFFQALLGAIIYFLFWKGEGELQTSESA
ncbi:MAG TPA: lysylphosphatidylglycerol synthase transmembrane domain-containing protein, partial [Anaerolineales bacterium]|nr:lysylphosphatidylglycerol synthase transmembrane domain-containing protein [Anaerolineales bacterium]